MILFFLSLLLSLLSAFLVSPHLPSLSLPAPFHLLLHLPALPPGFFPSVLRYKSCLFKHRVFVCLPVLCIFSTYVASLDFPTLFCTHIKVCQLSIPFENSPVPYYRTTLLRFTIFTQMLNYIIVQALFCTQAPDTAMRWLQLPGCEETELHCCFESEF